MSLLHASSKVENAVIVEVDEALGVGTTGPLLDFELDSMSVGKETSTTTIIP